MSQQKVSNERKKELEQLDPFQEKVLKTVAFLKEYKKHIIMVIGAVTAVVIALSAVMYSFKKSEETAALLVSRALSEYAAVNDPDKGYQEVKDDFEIVFKEYSNTTAGKQARVRFAKICFDASKFDQSFIAYKKALDVFKDNSLMKNFILASLGHVCIAKKDYEGAKTYFLQIENSDSGLLKDEAEYALATLYEMENNMPESKKKYEEIVSNYKDSIYLPLAEAKIK